MTNLRMIVSTNPTIGLSELIVFNPEFEEKVTEAANHFRDEIALIISESLKSFKQSGNDVSMLYSDARNPILSVKFNLEKGDGE